MAHDAIVIGGGIHGCSVALHLARQGLRVALYERETVGRHASGVNAGSIHHIARLIPELPLAQTTLRAWRSIGDLVDDDCGYRPVGHLKIAENGEDLEILRAAAAKVHEHSSIAEEILDQAALRKLEPFVAPDCVGGVYSPDCGYAVPGRSIQAFKRAAQRQKVCFREGEPVLGLARSGGIWQVTTASGKDEAPVVVNCAGAWGGEIARMTGDDVAVTPLALMLTVLARLRPVMGTVIGLTRRLLSAKQFENGTVVIGGGYRGTVDPQTRTARIDVSQLGYNLRAAVEAYPVLREGRVVRCWAGIEGRSPDGLPIIGPSAAAPGLWHAFAFSSHGFFLGPAVGSALAEEIVTGSRSGLLAPFAIDRF